MLNNVVIIYDEIVCSGGSIFQFENMERHTIKDIADYVTL